MIAASRNAEQALQVADADLVPLGELIRRTPGAPLISSIDDLRCDAFGTEEETEEFLAFVAESRRGARERRQQDVVPEVRKLDLLARLGQIDRRIGTGLLSTGTVSHAAHIVRFGAPSGGLASVTDHDPASELGGSPPGMGGPAAAGLADYPRWLS